MIIDEMENKEFFTPLTIKEFTTPINGRDNAYILTHNGEMMGLAVATCDIPEVLEEYNLPKGNYMLIDSIMISREYRGSNLLKQLIDFLYERASKLKVDSLVATVHPSNTYSLNPFYDKEFKLMHILKIHGGPRCILVKEVKNKY